MSYVEAATWIAAALLVAVIAYGWLTRGARPPASMPAELAEAKLWLAEKQIKCETPVPLHGKPDQVFRLRNGKLVVVEVKTRSRVFRSDIMQMSVYRTILVSSGEDVADYGYIRTVTAAGERFLRRPLYEPRIVVAAWKRYHEMKAGAVMPARSSFKRLCSTCGHRDRCNAR